MKKRIYEVKSLEEAQNQAITDLCLSLNDLNFDVISEKKGFLGIGGKITVEVTTKVDGITKGKEYIQAVLNGNNVEGYIETKIRGDIVQYNVEAHDFNGYLIGKNGRNLLALQTLVSIVVNNYYEGDESKNVLVDIGDYKDRRKRQLEQLAVNVGKQVSRTKQPAKLDNLNAYERKIIHAKLSTWKDVKTHSEGESPERYLVISPK